VLKYFYIKANPGISGDTIETNMTREEREKIFKQININSIISSALEKGFFIKSIKGNSPILFVARKTNTRDFANRSNYEILIIKDPKIPDIDKILEKFKFIELSSEIKKELKKETNYKLKSPSILIIILTSFLFLVALIALILYFWGGQNAS